MADYSGLSLDQLGELLRKSQEQDNERGILDQTRIGQYEQVFGLLGKVKEQQKFFSRCRAAVVRRRDAIPDWPVGDGQPAGDWARSHP